MTSPHRGLTLTRSGRDAIEDLDDSGFKGILGTDHQEAIVPDQLLQDFRAVA